MGSAKGLPYASIELESLGSIKPTMGFVTHKLDFEHLSEAFSRRDDDPRTEVLIICSKTRLKGWAGPVARFIPRMWVMLCREKAYESWTARRMSRQTSLAWNTGATGCPSRRGSRTLWNERRCHTLSEAS